MKLISFKACFLSAALLVSAIRIHAQVCSDPGATAETKALFRKLYMLQRNYYIFGHQDALAYGVNRKNARGKGDIKLVVNDNPGIYGWDIANIELDSVNNIDAVPFKKMQQYIKEGYKRGAVITISWHLHNPLTGGSAWDTTTGSVASILPGAPKHELYKSWLNRVALFMNGLKGNRGEKIPVLFRPFHEFTGNWFWWCKNVATAAEFKQLWQFTVNYLRNEKNLHQLLFVYNAAGFETQKDFLDRYPGDDMTDVLSFDQYQFSLNEREKFIASMQRQLSILCSITKQKKKIAALAETGFEAVPDKEWWTKTLWPAMNAFPLSYVLVWRNHGYMPATQKMHFYAPYPGQVSAEDFKKFYADPRILFEQKLKRHQVYQ